MRIARRGGMRRNRTNTPTAQANSTSVESTAATVGPSTGVYVSRNGKPLPRGGREGKDSHPNGDPPRGPAQGGLEAVGGVLPGAGRGGRQGLVRQRPPPVV